MVDGVHARLAVPADLRQVATARRFVRSALADSAAADHSSDLQLLASELVTNAIEHGAGGDVLVEIDVADSSARLTVHSVGPSPDVGPVGGWEVADVAEISGRGLGIVRALADDVDVRQSRDELVVTVLRRLSPSG